MSLINCPECAKSVSDKAAVCPDCAYPLAQINFDSKSSISSATTVEQTSKKWKKIKAIAGLLILIGMIFSFNENPSVGAILMAGGLIIAIYAGFGSWWHHA